MPMLAVGLEGRTEEGATGRVIRATRATLEATRSELLFCFKDGNDYSPLLFLTHRPATNIAH